MFVYTNGEYTDMYLIYTFSTAIVAREMEEMVVQRFANIDKYTSGCNWNWCLPQLDMECSSYWKDAPIPYAEAGHSF